MLIPIYPTIVPFVPIEHKPTLFGLMGWLRTGENPLSDLVMRYFTDFYMRHEASVTLKHLFESSSVKGGYW